MDKLAFKAILKEYEEKQEQLNKKEMQINFSHSAKKYKTPDGYTADIAIFTIGMSEDRKPTLQLVLIQRSEYNAEGNINAEPLRWALPGGFISFKETAIQAALRELREETSLDCIHLKHFGTYDKPGRDQRGWIITNAFYAIVPLDKLKERKANDDAVRVELFDLEQVFQLPLAFDHSDIIRDAICHIQKDLLETTVAKNFLPKQFTLLELREVLMTVSKHPNIVEKAAFYRKIPTLSFISMVYDGNGQPLTTTRNSKRPSKLYTFNDNKTDVSIYY